MCQANDGSLKGQRKQSCGNGNSFISSQRETKLLGLFPSVKPEIHKLRCLPTAIRSSLPKPEGDSPRHFIPLQVKCCLNEFIQVLIQIIRPANFTKCWMSCYESDNCLDLEILKCLQCMEIDICFYTTMKYIFHNVLY